MKKNKAQMELMGLAVVLILLAIGFLFVVSFVILKPSTDHTKSFRDIYLPRDFLNTLINTNSPECSDAQFRTLFIDCAENFNYGGLIVCGPNQQNSCKYLEETTTRFIDETFAKWHLNATFFVTFDANNLKDDSKYLWPSQKNNSCTSYKPSIQPLPSQPQSSLVLYLC